MANNKKQIVVVEDDTALLPMITYNLEKNGFSAATASHFLQRLAKKSFPPILFSVNSSDKLVP